MSLMFIVNTSSDHTLAARAFGWTPAHLPICWELKAMYNSNVTTATIHNSFQLPMVVKDAGSDFDSPLHFHGQESGKNSF